jgi:hypothetical protein
MMMQRHRRLYQSLKKQPLRARASAPDILQNLMSRKEFPAIEVFNAEAIEARSYGVVVKHNIRCSQTIQSGHFQ